MPRKTCTRASSLTRALRGLEEDGELFQVGVAELPEARHLRARIDAARALEVVDLELDPLVLRALLRKGGRAEVRRAGPEIGVAVGTAGLGEQLRPRNRGRVVRETLLGRPFRYQRDHLARDRLLRRRALVREHAHRDH